MCDNGVIKSNTGVIPLSSNYLRHVSRERTVKKKKDKVRSIKLPSDIDAEFEAHCKHYDISYNEAVLRLILHELGKEDLSAKQVSVTKEIPSNTASNTGVIPEEYFSNTKEYQSITPVTPPVTPRITSVTPKKHHGNTMGTRRRQSSRFTVKPYEVDGSVPCPICQTWQSYKNFSRHCKDMHGGKTSQDVIESNRDVVEAMVRKARGEG